MKKLFLIRILLLLFAFILFSSCSNSNNDDAIVPIKNNESGSVSARIGGDCPPGTHAVFVLSFDGFNFHRPKKACESGFWFCFKAPTTSIQCVNDQGQPVEASLDISARTATIWGQPVNDKVELHFPIALKDVEGYTEEDLSTFNVDEEYEIANGIILKPGNYSVTETENELVILIDLL